MTSAPMPPGKTTIPASALDENEHLLGPEDIPLSALMDASEIMRFAESIAELTQMECSALLYDPEEPCPVVPEGGIQIIRSPICQALQEVRGGEYSQCVWDAHAAAHKALEAREPVTADCAGGENTLYVCPIVLSLGDETFPKAAIVAAAQDIFNFHYADKLAEVLDRPVAQVEDLMCQTDERCPNAAQLRRIRAIMRGQTVSFSRQISYRYEEYEALARIMQQQEELSNAYSRLDRECRLVGQIQRRLVPERTPDIPGFEVATHYRPARQASGDYYDFFARPDGAWGILVADVSGHGADAAVVMAMMRTMMHACPAKEEAGPEKVLYYANNRLCADIMSDQFATAFFGIIEPGGTFTGACGGHGAPLLYNQQTGEITELVTDGGFPLGLVPDSEFSVCEAQMDPGDVLVLYTDGVTDVFNGDGHTFGVSRLRNSVERNADKGATGVLDGIVKAANDFAQGQPQHDDETVIVVKRR